MKLYFFRNKSQVNRISCIVNKASPGVGEPKHNIRDREAMEAMEGRKEKERKEEKWEWSVETL